MRDDVRVRIARSFSRAEMRRNAQVFHVHFHFRRTSNDSVTECAGFASPRDVASLLPPPLRFMRSCVDASTSTSFTHRCSSSARERASAHRSAARGSRSRPRRRSNALRASARDDPEVVPADSAFECARDTNEFSNVERARARGKAMDGVKRFLAAQPPPLREPRGARRPYASTMATLRAMARDSGFALDRIVWAPAFWALAFRERWSASEVEEAARELRGAGVEYFIEKCAASRDFPLAERAYEACMDGYLHLDSGRTRTLKMSMAKAYDGDRASGDRADAMWAEVLRDETLAKARCDTYCEMLEGRCLQPMRFDAFVRAYDDFRREFRDEDVGEWRRGASRLHAKRAYTAACRMINNTHNSKFAKVVTRDVLRDHAKYFRDDNYALATDFMVCALLGAASESVVVARELFEIALESGVKLGGQTWAYAVTMYVRQDALDDAMKLLERLEGLPFMQSGSLGALAFAAAFAVDGSTKNPTAAAKMAQRAKELKDVEANNSRQRQKVERAYSDVMSGLNKDGKPQLALRVFTRMQSSGVRPASPQTYRNLYDALKLADDGHSLSRQMFYRTMQTVKSHLKGVDALMVALEIAAYDGVVDVADDVYARLRWHGHLKDAKINSRVLDCLMIAKNKSRDQRGAMELYESVRRADDVNVVVSDDFWFYLLKTHCDEPANVEVAVVILEDAIHENASRRRKALTIAAFNIVLQACARSKTPKQAMKVLAMARRCGVRFGQLTYLSAIRACVSAAQIQRDVSHGRVNLLVDEDDDPVRLARRLLDDMREDELAPTSKIWSAVLYACACAGDMDAAQEVFQEMRASGCEPDVHSCTALIKAYAMTNDARGAIGMYWTMRNEFNCAPNSSTLQAIIEVVRGALKAHEEDLMQEASDVYLDMRRLKVKPNNAIFELLTESWVEETLLAASAPAKKKLSFALNDFTANGYDEATSWEDIAEIDVHEYSAAEARVAVLGVLQHLRQRDESGAMIGGDITIICGVGNIREKILKLADDLRLALTPSDNAGRLVLTRDAIRLWFDKQ